MPTDPTPTAADFEAARDLRNVVHRYSCGTVGIDVVDDALARAIATAREAGQDVEVGRRRRLIDRARADGDAAGYARGREESDKLTGDLQNLVRDTLIRSATALGVEGADMAIDGGGSDGDELDFTEAELSIGLALIEEAAEAKGRAESAERISELQHDAEMAAAAENANAADLRAARERIAALEALVQEARVTLGRVQATLEALPSPAAPPVAGSWTWREEGGGWGLYRGDHQTDWWHGGVFTRRQIIGEARRLRGKDVPTLPPTGGAS